MCFVLYMGSQTQPPHIAWDQTAPGLCTAPVGQHDEAIRHKFSLQHVTYVGSDQSCGCGFRNVMYQGGAWPEEGFLDPAPEQQKNHDDLVEFIRRHLGGEASVELYGCWYGDFAEPAAARLEIGLPSILDSGFHFRDRVLYTVPLSDQPLSS